MALQLDSLFKAVEALQRSLRVSHEMPEKQSEDMQEVIRAGIIQNFEVAYEQCWKFMQRWLRENAAPGDAEILRTRKELFRLAARYKLIDDINVWFEYGDARNMTSHTYEEDNTEFVYKVAERFVVDAEKLLLRLSNEREK